jgi:hypothetical protein
MCTGNAGVTAIDLLAVMHEEISLLPESLLELRTGRRLDAAQGERRRKLERHRAIRGPVEALARDPQELSDHSRHPPRHPPIGRNFRRKSPCRG